MYQGGNDKNWPVFIITALSSLVIKTEETLAILGHGEMYL